jgi:hypothetical protein
LWVFFWIDSICINQSNLQERNHQVGLMKQIFLQAIDVYVWLGPKADNSDIGMDYIAKKGARRLRACGPGFKPLWSRAEGKAVYHLCERSYWRRMWIIQEIVHARKVTVLCGTKSFDWANFENLYLNLKTLEDTGWFAHHAFAIAMLQSSAGMMLWQRAHWQHPQTPIPDLLTLIEIFREWQCTDLRDKVFALVGMANSKTAITPNYSQSAFEVYCEVLGKYGDVKPQVRDMLSQLLGLSNRELNFFGRSL